MPNENGTALFNARMNPAVITVLRAISPEGNRETLKSMGNTYVN